MAIASLTHTLVGIPVVVLTPNKASIEGFYVEGSFKDRSHRPDLPPIVEIRRGQFSGMPVCYQCRTIFFLTEEDLLASGLSTEVAKVDPQVFGASS